MRIPDTGIRPMTGPTELPLTAPSGPIAGPVQCGPNAAEQTAEDLRVRARWVSALRRVEAQTRTAGRMVAAGADPDRVVTRLITMIRTLRTVGAEVSGNHVGHCVDHGLRYGESAAATAAGELAAAIRALVQD